MTIHSFEDVLHDLHDAHLSVAQIKLTAMARWDARIIQTHAVPWWVATPGEAGHCDDMEKRQNWLLHRSLLLLFFKVNNTLKDTHVLTRSSSNKKASTDITCTATGLNGAGTDFFASTATLQTFTWKKKTNLSHDVHKLTFHRDK